MSNYFQTYPYLFFCYWNSGLQKKFKCLASDVPLLFFAIIYNAVEVILDDNRDKKGHSSKEGPY